VTFDEAEKTISTQRTYPSGVGLVSQVTACVPPAAAQRG